MTSSPRTDGDLVALLRTGRDALISEIGQPARRFGYGLADLLDATLSELIERSGVHDVAVVALGSYARRELAPGSDVDVLLVLPERRRFAPRRDSRALAERLWYPLWDAGLVTGHGARTVKESLSLIDDDVDAATALLDIRFVSGDRSLALDLAVRSRRHIQSRRVTLLETLAHASDARRHKPGLVSEMLEPNLKDGGGALRDIHTLRWANALLSEREPTLDGYPGVVLPALIEAGALSSSDVAVIDEANDLFVRVRLALHQMNNGRSDLLALQDQDAVSELCGAENADELARSIAHAARTVAWLLREVWAALLAAEARDVGPLASGLELRDGRLTIRDDELALGSPVPTRLVLELAVAAAEHECAIARATLERLRDCNVPTWSTDERELFIRLLRHGARAVAVFEALDQVDVVARLLPEWAHVRSLPQRNAYHRHTVDRHLLEAVSQCAHLLDATNSPAREVPLDVVIARACRRPELLLLSALLHDIAKGMPEDHAVAGARIAVDVGRRIGLDSEGVEILEWLVRDHLLMAETATRRDLSDAETIDRFCRPLAGDGERLRLLYLLTIGDSIATGPAAWSKSKAALLRDLFVKAAATVESDSTEAVVHERLEALRARVGNEVADAHFAAMPSGYPLAFDLDVMCTHISLLQDRSLAIGCDRSEGSEVVVTVAAPDRTGLLATVAGALTCCGLAVREAALFTSTDGMALDVFTADDTFGRFDAAGEARVRSTIERAIAGDLDVAAGVEERRRHYQRNDRDVGSAGRGVEIIIDNDASLTATIIEVHANDQMGLLFRLASAFSDADIDVSVAKVATLADRVVDAFYVSQHGVKLPEGLVLDAIRTTVTRIATGS